MGVGSDQQLNYCVRNVLQKCVFWIKIKQFVGSVPGPDVGVGVPGV